MRDRKSRAALFSILLLLTTNDSLKLYYYGDLGQVQLTNNFRNVIIATIKKMFTISSMA